MTTPNVPNGLQLHASAIILATAVVVPGSDVNIAGVTLALPDAMDITLGTEIDPLQRFPVTFLQVTPGGFFVVMGYDPAFDTPSNIRIVSSAPFGLGPLNYSLMVYRTI